MASQIIKCATLVILSFFVCAVLYTTEFSLGSEDFKIAAQVDKTPSKQITRATSYFHVSKYNVTGKKLELKGNFKLNDSKGTNTHKMVIDGLEKLISDGKSNIWNDEKLDQFYLPKQHYFERDMRVTDVDCKAMIKGDEKEIEKADKLSETQPKRGYSAEYYINLTSNCTNFIYKRGYIMDSLTEAEKEFSIAYSLLMFKDIEQSERLFRAIYRPQHWYCFHVDSKTDQTIYKAMKNIANCFENVFMSDKRFNVQWGKITVLQPELNCMKQLWNKSKKWKYFINLTGQEFPLRTNYELVQILQAYNGANDVEATVKHANKGRWEGAGTPPHGIVATKGSVHITASRGFVDYILHDQRAQDFLEWTNKTKVPDETYFASLNHNPVLGVPGSYRGLAENDIHSDVKPFVTRFKNWGNGQYDWPCEGQRVRMICVFGSGDLPLLASRRELFANKFYLDYKHYALDCMEELHFNHTRDEYLGKLQFDVRWYEQLGFVKNKID